MIGVFDSGVGGFTVLRELVRRMPERGYVYFGDTARTPYGNKGPETITSYALQDARFLIEQGATSIVIACHTASAIAADRIRREFEIPVFDVVSASLQAVEALSSSARIGVIGTTATIQSRIYPERLAGSKRQVISQACPLFVPLVEEGWLKHPETKRIAARYLRPLKLQQIDTLILACTHYPLLRQVIQHKIGRRVRLIDPAEEVAGVLARYFAEHSSEGASSQRQRLLYCSDRTPAIEKIAASWLEGSWEFREHRLE